MDTVNMAVWLSRLIRWGLGIFFLVLAYQNDDARILYLFGGVLMITGFFKPKRCINGACATDVNTSATNAFISYEEVI